MERKSELRLSEIKFKTVSGIWGVGAGCGMGMCEGKGVGGWEEEDEAFEEV